MLKRIILPFSLLILAILFLFRISSMSLYRSGSTLEYWIAGFSILFFILGYAFTRKDQWKGSDAHLEAVTVNVEEFIPSEEKVKQLGISQREFEVLQLIGEGMSNKEIAAHLFLSESTIKSHVSSLLAKLDVKRRTQAIVVAKEMHLLA